MGIYIPNMSKPKDCMDCIVEEYADCDICKGVVSASKYADRRYEHCTLIEIVTCGECIHKMQALSTEKGATGCELISGTFYEDFFCKEGERRADEGVFSRG